MSSSNWRRRNGEPMLQGDLHGFIQVFYRAAGFSIQFGEEITCSCRTGDEDELRPIGQYLVGVQNSCGDIGKATRSRQHFAVANGKFHFSLKHEVSLAPLGGGAPYDLIVDTGSRLLKVQVKTGRLRNGCVIYDVRRMSGRGNLNRKKYAVGEVDFFAVFCPDNETIYMIPAH